MPETYLNKQNTGFSQGPYQKYTEHLGNGFQVLILACKMVLDNSNNINNTNKPLKYYIES